MTLGILVVFRFLPFHPILVLAGVVQNEQTVFLDGPFPGLRDGQTAAGQLAAVHVGLDQAGIGVHLRRRQPQPEQFVIQALEDGAEALSASPLDEVADGGMVEDRVVDGEEAKPAVGQILGYGGTQPPEGGDVVQGADKERPDHDFRVDGGATVVRAIVPLQGSYQLGEIELLVNAGSADGRGR